MFLVSGSGPVIKGFTLNKHAWLRCINWLPHYSFLFGDNLFQPSKWVNALGRTTSGYPQFPKSSQTEVKAFIPKWSLIRRVECSSFFFFLIPLKNFFCLSLMKYLCIAGQDLPYNTLSSLNIRGQKSILLILIFLFADFITWHSLSVDILISFTNLVVNSPFLAS